MRPCGLLVTAVVLLGVAGILRADDSYVNALKHSKQDVMDTPTVDTDSRIARNDFQPSAGFPADNSPATTTFESPATAYGAPAHSTYGAPAPAYGAPAPAYGAPSVGEWVTSSTSYQHAQSSGPPKPVYGAPGPVYEHAARPVYVPTIHQVYYGHSAPPAPPAAGWEGPRDSHWLLNKLKFKLDFFTIGKILLKLIIFKKIVKFIALICLLLFLPKLQSLSGHDDEVKDDEALEERRQFDVKYDLGARINETTTFALAAMDAFSRKYPDECGGPLDITCRFGKMMDAVDARYPYQKIVSMYLPKNEVVTNEIEN